MAIARMVVVWSLAAPSLHAQDKAFLLTTDDPRHDPPTAIGNGRFSLLTSPRGTEATHSYLAGLYEHAPGDVPRIASLPAWNEVDVFDGEHWLNASPLSNIVLRSYTQAVDMRNGTVETTYDWLDGERRTSIRVLAFVSRSDANLAVVRLEIVPHFTGPMRVSLPLSAWSPPRRLALAKVERYDPAWSTADVWYPGHVAVQSRRVTVDAAGRGARLSMTARAAGRPSTVALAAAVALPPALKAQLRQWTSPTRVAVEVAFDAVAETPYTFDKIVTVVSSAEASMPLGRAERAAVAARARGFDVLLREHASAWNALWETDIVIEGDSALQRAARSMMFYLLCSARPGSALGIPPMGLSSAGYYGHIFWDSDTWMFPALVVTHPDIAQSLVAFRSRTLPAARRNARANGFRGAMYPWEADDLGEETTPRFAFQNARSEVHVTADVAIAQWQYYLATGDSLYLARHAYPVLQATADFWTSRAVHDVARERYDIRNVVSVDEGLIGVGNDAYTNAVAKRNLDIAVAASRVLGRRAPVSWQRVADGLVIPYSEAGEYHPTYEGAPDSTLGSVVPLLSFPLEVAMSERARRTDLTHAIRRLAEQGPGAMMTVTLYPVIAAELGDQALLDSLVPLTYRSHMRKPFDVLAETPSSKAVNFVTGAGGFLQQVLFGYTGLRLSEQGLTPRFPPLLPSGVTRLVLRNLQVRGEHLDIIVDAEGLHRVPRELPR